MTRSSSMATLKGWGRAVAGPRRAAATVRRFHRMYYDNFGRTWRNTRWLGVRVQKCPLDLWIYQELLERKRPELVIETGTADGGSALFLASCMDLIRTGRVVTIDIDDEPQRPDHPRIEYVAGSSIDPAVVARARAAAEGAASVMVILDSDHTCEHVLSELRLYSDLVTPGSYLVVEDTNVNGHPVDPSFGPGPHEAVELFLADHPDFTRDTGCEKFFLTFNPGGYLQRAER